MPRKLTQEEFIEKCKNVHGDRYDYSLTEYINAKSKIKIICKQHGVFKQRPDHHLNGNGCSICGNEYVSNKITKNTDKFIIDSINIHGNRYDYSLVEYKNSNTKVKIICPIHGEFKQLPLNHLSGYGCVKCGVFNRVSKQRKNIDKFISDVRVIHSDKYDYSLVEYKNNNTKIKIICKIHGIFEQTPKNHFYNRGCPKCNKSKGEEKIRLFLSDNNLIYKEQYRFTDCRYKKPLSFDFYLPDYNLCVEYDGEQHFKKVNYWGGEQDFNTRQKRDDIKNKYCKENNIKLLRVKYTEYNNIEKILKEKIIK